MDLQNDIMKMFKQFKLGQSVFKTSYKLSKDMLNTAISQDDMKAIAAKQAVHGLSEYIINHYKHAIKESDSNEYIEFQTELLVLEISNFKTIVEAAIQLIPQSEIDRIKLGQNVIS